MEPVTGKRSATTDNLIRRTRLTVFSLFVCALLQAQETFTNPVLPSGADPWCIYRNGFYYYTNTTRNNITLWKTDNPAHLSKAEKKIVFRPPAGTAYSKEMWAPELHYLDSKWYIYFAADSGHNKDHRMWVLENASADPLDGNWILKGKLETPGDKWSIDGTVYQHGRQLYFFWSGWEGDVNGQQNIYIAKMKNPWTIEGERARLSSPVLDWEKHGDLKNPNDVPHVNVNEGPQLLRHKDLVFLVYSASGCWTDHYALGMLSIPADRNLMDSAAWTKSPQPVFKQSTAHRVFAPGHNSFFQSPDGKEDWIFYHANSEPGQGCGKQRSPRMQPFKWNPDGTPCFGEPVKENEPMAVPASVSYKKKKIKIKSR